MSVRKCEHDQSQAKYACTTHNAYFCEQHYRQHISDLKPHVAFLIDMTLTQPDFEQLQKEVRKRIKALEHTKQQVASQAAQLIAKIEQALIISIENLNSKIRFYRAYSAFKSFDHQELQKITKILTTRLQIQIDQDLVVNCREEIEEEKTSSIKQPIEEAIREPIKEPEPLQELKIEEEKNIPLKQPIREAVKEPKRETPMKTIRETSSGHQAKLIPSNEIIRKYDKSPRQNCILSAANAERLPMDCR
jgi:hypothetical protein